MNSTKQTIPEADDISQLSPDAALDLVEKRVQAVIAAGAVRGDATIQRSAGHSVVRALWPDLYARSIGAIDPRVKEKMAGGLTREQAETVVRNQETSDAAGQ